MLQLLLSPIQPPITRTPEPVQWSQEEWARLDQITHPNRKAEFIAGHNLLRLLLDQWAHRLPLQAAPHQWQQKPAAAPSLVAYPHLVFGLSHCRGWVVAGLYFNAGQTPRLGVDIEMHRHRPRLAELANYSFGEAWVARHAPELEAPFFLRWTQCEAMVKASNLTLGTKLLRHQPFLSEQPMGHAHYQGHSALVAIDSMQFSLSVTTSGDAPEAPSLALYTPETGQIKQLDTHWTTWWSPVA